MSAALNNREIEISHALERMGFSRPQSVLAVVMATREHARTRAEMLHIVRQYAGLEDERIASEAIAALIEKQWMCESQSYGAYILHQASDLREKIAAQLNDPAIAHILHDVRAAEEPSVAIIGPMKDTYTYESYLQRIREAQDEILLPMLATSPGLASVPLLQERARAGVRVRILLGSPNAVGQLRGNAMMQVAADAISGWRKNAAQLPSMAIRIFDDIAGGDLASCMLVDGRVLRLDIYDARTQRSLQGVMIEVRSEPAAPANLVRIFRKQFFTLWYRSRPVDSNRAIWFFRSNPRASLLVIFVILSLFSWSYTLLAAIFTSVAATFMAELCIKHWPWSRSEGGEDAKG